MDDLARIILMVLAGGLTLALVRGGWNGRGGVRDWLSMKFLGKPATA